MVYLENKEIVRCYSQIIQALLNYYRLANNFSVVKSVIFQLKLGCVYTLAYKHNKTKRWVFLEFGKNCTILHQDQKILAELPSTNRILQNEIKSFYLQKRIFFELAEISRKFILRVYKSKFILGSCAVKGCVHFDIEFYYIKQNYYERF